MAPEDYETTPLTPAPATPTGNMRISFSYIYIYIIYMYAHVLGMCVRVSSHAPHNTTYVILFFHSQGSLSNKAEKKRKEGTASRRKVRDRLTKLNFSQRSDCPFVFCPFGHNHPPPTQRLSFSVLLCVASLPL